MRLEENSVRPPAHQLGLPLAKDTMKDNAKFESKVALNASPLERLIQLVSRVPFPPWLISVVLALFLAALAENLALGMSRLYYKSAPYGWDSVGYRHYGVSLYQAAQTEGVWTALRQRFSWKDGLDEELRLLIAPQTLLRFNGYMYVLFPYLAVFIFLLIWYVYVRTGSLLLGLATASFLFTLPVMYYPMIFGIADYDLNPLSTWLWVGAALAWLLSERLTRVGWSFLSGLLLGVLVMQRTASATIVAPIFLPFVLWTFYRRLALDGWRQALVRIGVFAAPAALLAGLVAYCQWAELYQYYFGLTAGAYKTYSGIGEILEIYRYGLSERQTPLIVLAATVALCLLGVSSWKRQGREILTACWLVVGVPLVVIGILVVNHNGFFPLWEPTLLILLATAIPWSLSPDTRRLLAVALLTVGISASVVEYNATRAYTKETAETQAPTRAFFQNIREIILAQPEPRAFGLFFAPEMEEIFWNHFFFPGPNENRVELSAAVMMYSRDNDWIESLGDIPPEEAASQYISTLEGTEGTLAVIHCDREAVKQAFNPFTQHFTDRIPYSQKVALGIYDHLLSSNHWKVTQQLASPFGDVYIFQYGSAEISEVEKWGEVQPNVGLSEVLLASSVAPSVRVLRAVTRCDSQVVAGILYQNLPTGKEGSRVTVYSDAERTVSFHANATPIPADSQQAYTLVFLVNGQEATVQLQGEQEINLPVALQAGLNQLEWYVEAPELGDSNDPVLLLTSPQFIAGP
jgi:hypothetical protein